MEFDEYISLGDNCEAGMNFWRIGYDYGSLFRFGLGKLDKILNVIKSDFEGLLEDVEPSADSMIRCKKYDVAFHSKMRSSIREGTRVFNDFDDIESMHRDDIEKVKFFVRRMKEDFASSKNILYIIKQNSGVSDGQILAFEELISELSNGKDFRLLCLSDKIGGESKQIGKYSVVEPVGFFAPYMDVKKYDHEAWDRVFGKYPLRDKGRLSVKNESNILPTPKAIAL